MSGPGSRWSASGRNLLRQAADEFRYRQMSEPVRVRAKFPGVCRACGKPYEKGVMLKKLLGPGNWVHAKDCRKEIGDELLPASPGREFPGDRVAS